MKIASSRRLRSFLRFVRKRRRLLATAGCFLRFVTFTRNHKPRFPRNAEPANLFSAGQKIVCLGDSITRGIGASSGSDYPSLLARDLGMHVVNAGVKGDETEDVLKRLEADVLSHNPWLVI